MRIARLAPLALIAVLVAPLGSHAAGHLTATVEGAQEVPPTGSPGSGFGHFLIDTDTNTLFYHISFGGLAGTESAAHIHGFAAPGANAGVVHALPTGSPKIGAWNYAEGQEASILGGLCYVNIHSTVNPGGEIRGQIVPEPATDMVALINGAQEVPPTGSTGLGIGAFDLDTSANTLSYDIRFGALVGTESAAHIHGFAAPGANAGVVHALPAGSPKIGTWNYAEGQEASILSGLTYVNIHSNVNPGGEIRGQVELPSPAVGVDDVSVALGGDALLAAPNPVASGSSVALFYSLPREGRVTVDVFDATGRRVRRVHDAPSRARGIVSWDTRDEAGRAVAAGVYFAALSSEDGRETRRIVVLR